MISGLIRVPIDKSIAQRAMLIGAMASGETRIENLASSLSAPGDSLVLTAMAARQYALGQYDEPFYCGGSAFLARALCGMLVGLPSDCEITGDEHLSLRPMKRVIEPIELMNAGIMAAGEGEDFHLPLKTLGGIKLRGIEYEMPVKSAQVKTAILFAGLFAEGPTVIYEPELTRDHTEIMLRQFGAALRCDAWNPQAKQVLKGVKPGSNEAVEAGATGSRIILLPGERLVGQSIHVPGDFSSAAYFIALALLLPESMILLQDVGLNPTRTGFINIARKMGADIEVKHQLSAVLAGDVPYEPVGDITVRSSHLHGITISEKDGLASCIDELPLIAVLASFASGKTVIKGAGELRVKECDRIHAMSENLSAMGVKIEERQDGWVIYGAGEARKASLDACENSIAATPYTSAPLTCYGDHRIAMCMAVARLAAGLDISADEPSSEGTPLCDIVKISFPGFFDELKKHIK